MILHVPGAPREPVLFAFYADCHGVFDHVERGRDRAGAVFLLGDQTPVGQTLEEALCPDAVARTHWIFGNHDADQPEYLSAHDSMADRNLHGRVVTVHGVRVAGLGGTFRGKVWMPGQGPPRARTREEFLGRIGRHLRGKLPDRHRATIFPEDVKALANQRANVLICHEAPESHPFGFREIGDLARAMGVAAVLHGHHHRPARRVEIEGGIMGVRRIRFSGHG